MVFCWFQNDSLTLSTVFIEREKINPENQKKKIKKRKSKKENPKKRKSKKENQNPKKLKTEKEEFEWI